MKISRRQWLIFSFFVMGLLSMDQAVRRWGNLLLASPYWAHTIYSRATKLEKNSVALVGDCRPLVLQRRLLENEFQRPTVNLGKSGGLMGHMLFSLKLLQDRAPKGSTVVLFLTEDILTQTTAETKDELNSLSLYWPLLSHESAVQLESETGVAPWAGDKLSGLWRFRGRGTLLARATYQKIRHIPTLIEEADDIVFALAGEQNNYRKPIEKNWQENKTTYAWLTDAISEAKAAGLNIVFVVPPLHRNALPEATALKIAEKIDELGKSFQSRVVNYFQIQNRWALTDKYWGNAFHLNRVGALAFSEALSSDLKGVLR